MAGKAIYEKRQFVNPNGGEIISYDFYGIVSEVEGERMELKLANLSNPEKIAFRIVAQGSDISDENLSVQTVQNKGRSPEVTRKSDDTIDLDEVESDKGMFD